MKLTALTPWIVLSLALFFGAWLAGCTPHFTTLAAGTADGVTCTEWSAVHPIAGTTNWVTCRTETDALVTPPSSHSSSPLATITDAASAVVP